MNLLDLGIIIIIVFGAVIGFKRGFTRELVEATGFIMVIVLSYLLKNPLSIFLYERLPFFKIGFLKGFDILNIIVYELIAFFICAAILYLILKLLVKFTSIFEKLLNMTIILSIPSKIAGALVGVLHYFVFVFIVLYVLSLTCFDVDFVNESKFKDKIVNHTPLFTNLANNSVKVIDEFAELKVSYDDRTMSEYEFNYKAIELFLKYNVISKESLSKLFESGKLEKFDNYSELLD